VVLSFNSPPELGIREACLDESLTPVRATLEQFINKNIKDARVRSANVFGGSFEHGCMRRSSDLREEDLEKRVAEEWPRPLV
jgi:hypothetical protein